MIRCKDLKEFLNENVPDDTMIEFIDLTWFTDLTKHNLIVVGLDNDKNNKVVGIMGYNGGIDE